MKMKAFKKPQYARINLIIQFFRAELSEERSREISERMTKYWANRKTNNNTNANKLMI